MKHTIKRTIAVLLFVIITVTSLRINEEKAQAKTESKYMTKIEFIREVVKEMKLPVADETDKCYINAAIEAKLISKTTFLIYSPKVTLQVAAAILAKADEYCWGKTITDEDVDLITSSRITDISTVKRYWRSWFAKAYAMGYIAGKSDGTYTNTRTFNVKKKVKTVTLRQMIDRLLNKEARYKLSPTWQMLRTTKLPLTTNFYPYILDSFPNEYYDWEFFFMKTVNNGTGNHYDKVSKYYIEKQDYCLFCTPADFKDCMEKKFYNTYYFSGIRSKEKFLTEIEQYLKYAFNFDYRTIEEDEEWMNVMYEYFSDEYLNTFINACKKNETIIECDKVGLDESSLYWDTGDGVLIRVYVHFRVVSSRGMTAEDFGRSPMLPNIGWEYNTIEGNYTVGEWRDGYYEISAMPNVDMVVKSIGSLGRTLCQARLCDYNYSHYESNFFRDLIKQKQ